MRVQIELDGSLDYASPLIHHSEVLADPISPEAKWVKEISSKTKKSDADHYELSWREWCTGMYFDDEVGPILPTSNIIASLHEGAKMLRLGTTIEKGGILPEVDFVALEYDGPRTKEEMWKAGTFCLRKGVVISRKRVHKSRPMFSNWKATATLTVDPFLLDFDKVENIARYAGRYIGIGDNRKKGWGRYVPTLMLISDDADLFDAFDENATELDKKATQAMIKNAQSASEAHVKKHTKARSNGS